jgi:hypothetical protein
MAAAKSDPANTKPASEPEVETISEQETVEQLIAASFPELAKPEPEIINDFYESLGVPYCKKCGERSRTSDGENTFCPITKPNCSGFSV